MKITLISVLLFVELTCGYSIQKTPSKASPQENQTEANTKTDVYEIQESDKKAVRIVYPRAEKPTLREIIYYHVIETPYENHGSVDISKEREGPDFDQTRRPFTNSHGFQFLPEDPEIIDYTKNEINSDINSNLTMSDEDADDDDIDMGSFLTEDSDEEAVTTEIIEIDDSSNETTERTEKIQEVETDEDVSLQIEDETDSQEISSQNSTKAMNLSKDTIKTDSTTPTLDTTATSVNNMEDLEVTTLKTDDVVEEKKNARNLLFSQVRNKYQNFRRSGKPAERPKRHVSASDIPEAPILPPLNVKKVIKVIPTPKPNTVAPNSQEELTTFSDEDQDLKEDIEREIKEMMAILKLKDGDDTKLEHENDEHEVKNKRVPRTFGMNLTNDQGYVWNDLWTEKGTFVERPKRHVSASDMPEAPTLPPLNLDRLLENFRKVIKVIPTPKPNTVAPNSQEELTTFNDEDQDFKEEIEKKIKEMIASLKPKDGDDIKLEHENDEHEVKNKRVPRTFGMNLTNDKGYVWNDLWTEPGISFDVGESAEDVPEDKKKETDIPNTVTFSAILHPTESRPIYTDSYENSNHEMSLVDNEDRESESEDLEDIFVNNRKPTVIAETTDSAKKEKDFPKDQKTTEKHEETLNEDNITAAPSDNKPDKDKFSADKEAQIEEKAISDKPDLLQELMKNEQFWKWLGDWTAAYMEMLMKHVKNIVHEEVSRQIKKQVSELKDDLINEIKIKSEYKEKEPESYNLEKKIDDGEKSAKDENKLDQLPKNETGDSETTTNNTLSSEIDCSRVKVKTDEAEKQPITNHSELNINGKEIPITHGSNLDENLKENKETVETILKHRRDKDDKFPVGLDNFNKTNDKAPITVTAKNIFGNSVGGEKVVNIFIFSKNSEKDDLINDLVNESQNLLSFEPNKKHNITEPEITGQKDESTMTEPENKPINLQETDSKADDKINNQEKEDKKVESITSLPDTITGNTKNPMDSIHNIDGDIIKENIPNNIENTQGVGESIITNKQKESTDNAKTSTSESPIDITTESVNKLENKNTEPEESKPNLEHIKDDTKSNNGDKQNESINYANTSTSENLIDVVTTEYVNKVEDKSTEQEEKKPNNKENSQDAGEITITGKQKESTDNTNTSASENSADVTTEFVNKVEEKNT